MPLVQLTAARAVGLDVPIRAARPRAAGALARGGRAVTDEAPGL